MTAPSDRSSLLESQHFGQPTKESTVLSRWFGLPAVVSFLSAERVLGSVLLLDDVSRPWLAIDSAGQRFLGGAIIEVLDLLVVVGFPMDEHADADEEIVGLGRRDDAFRNRIGDRLGNAILGRAEHLDRLLGALD